MNKKNLSVVMAGAMLATSVAPVLAAETTEVKKYELPAGQTGILKNELRTLLESKKFHRTDSRYANQSVYYYTIGLTGAPNRTVTTNLDNLAVGTKVYVWSEGFRTDSNGNYFSTADVAGDETSVGNYTVDTLKAAKTEIDNLIKAASSNHAYLTSATYLTASDELVVKLKDGRELVYGVGSPVVDFSKPVDSQGYTVTVKSTSDVATIAGFKSKTTSTAVGADLKNEKLAEITITNDGTNLKVEELYDGLMLTEKGHELLYNIKNAASSSVTAVTESYGVSSFTVTVTDKFNKSTTYKVSGDDNDNTNTLRDWLFNKHAKVDLLAGSNRYETAVKIAKETASLNKLSNITTTANVVLVNGNSLVDGLSAAPLASHLAGSTGNAPILLTEADSLPSATKAYLKELIQDAQVGKLDKITVNLVGGEAVLSKSLERELKSLGFNVERFGGDNREETSMEVAEEIGFDNGAFVVGAEGEADAMSIAGYASKKGNNTQTPIVVSKKGGLTEDTVYELKNKKVTVIGGETVVSANDYKSIEEVASAVRRIYGSNRKETNAKVIETFYPKSFGQNSGTTPVESVIVAKDGQNNKSELIDALTAANLASVQNAPVVLATDKLSNSQINALELNAKSADNLYQVGYGVNRNVVLTLAQRLGLAK